MSDQPPVLQRLLRYVAIDTQSSESSETDAVEAMEAAVKTLAQLVQIWVERSQA